MEFLDPNIENPTKGSVRKNAITNTEGKCFLETVDDPENNTMMTESSKMPEKPKGVINDHKGLIISWDVLSCNLQAIDFFEIQWKKTEEKNWSGRQCTDDKFTNITILMKELETNTSYQFKVRWITKEGAKSPFSEISDPIITRTLQKPGKPKGVTSNDTDLLISWNVSSTDLQTVDVFEIQWKKKDEKRWSGQTNTNDNSTSIKIPITELEKNTAYQFTVRWITQEGAEGPFSDISDDIIIELSQKPGKPKGVRCNDTDLLINWDVPLSELQAVDVFEIQWKKKDDKRWSGWKNTENNSTSIKIPITGFEKNTAYQFKVLWITHEGVESPFSDISDDIVIKMSQKPGKPKVVTSNDTDLLISWDVASTDLQAIDVFEIQWKRKDEKRWSGGTNTDENSTSIKIPITEFGKNTAYQFIVRWITTEGVASSFSDISDDIIIKMSQKPGKPNGVTSNDTDLLISWEVPSSELQAVGLFEIQWKKKDEKRWSGRKNTDDNTTSSTIPITDLEKNTAYQFKVRWITQEGVESPFSDISDDIIIKMSQKPGKPKVVTSKDKDLLISWEVPSSELQAVDVFEIQWKKKDQKRLSGRKTTEDNSTSIKIPITELEKNTAYQFIVRWITTEGVESSFSDISDEIIIKMSQKPGKPKQVTSNDTDLLINWEVTSSDLQAVDFFEIQWKKKDEKRWSGGKTTDGNSTSITIPSTELEMNTAYQFKVRWTTQEGAESPFSDISDDIIIKISQKPGKPKVVTSNDKDLLISWDVSSSDLEVVDVFEIQWKKTEEKRWSGREKTDDNSTSIKIPIADLEKNIAYQFKVRWITQEGVEGLFSDISDDIIIKISQRPGQPKGVISNDRDLLISWDVSATDLQDVDVFEIQWKEKEEKRWSGRKNTDDNSTSITIPITDLAKNTAYQFKVRWTTQEGVECPFSDISDDIIIKMSQKPGKPKKVASNDKDLLISWDVPSSDLQAVEVFEIQWKQNKDKRWPGRTNTDDNSTYIKIPITEFEKNTAYQFTVRWITTDGVESPFSDISDDIIIEMAQKPGKPKGVTSNDTDLLISWDVPSSDLHAVGVFKLQWKKKDEKRWSGRKTTDDKSTSIKIPITDLEKNTAYQFKVQWITTEGEESPFSDISDDIIIKMSPKPGKPKGVTSNDKDLLISWDVSSSDLQAVDVFEIQWKKKDEKRWSGQTNTDDNSTSIKIPITDLETNTAYQFKVLWITTEGVESPFSDISDDIVIKMAQKPGKPKGVTSNDTDLLISWDVPSSDLHAVGVFKLQWKKKDEKRWSGRKTTDDKSTSTKIPITDLEKNTAYQFKVQWITTEGEESPFSDISDDIITKMSPKPGKPKGVTSNDKDLLISWDVSSSDLQAVDVFEIQWKKKDEKRWSGQTNTDDNSTSIKIPITDLETNTAYQFKVLWITTEGVESPFSDISDDIVIEMAQKPGKPKGVTSNDTDLLISWDVPSSDLHAVGVFKLQWKKKDEKRWSGRKTTDDKSTSIKIPITDLEKNTAYQFKVQWITTEGEESPFSDISDDIITKMSPKPGKPKGVTSNDKDLLISWDVSSSDLQAVDVFEIQWKKKDEKRWSGQTNTDDNSTSIKIPITDLETNTAYQFKVLWITTEGVESPFSDISDDIIIEMAQKPGKPKGVTSNDTDLLISWDVPSSDLHAVGVFKLQWKKKDEKRWSGRKTTDDKSTSTKIPITDLEKNTAYQFKVQWITTEGVESPFSDISDDIIITISPKPGKPKGVTSNDTDLLISWEVPSSDLQAVGFFEIQWKKKDDKRWSGRKTTDDNATSIKIPITDLEMNTAYQFKVQWTTQEGVPSLFSDISDDIMVEMAPKPGKPKGITSNDKDLLISWDVSSSDLQAVEAFEVQWKRKDEIKWQRWKNTDDNSTSITIPITDFEKNTTYQFKVKWTTINGKDSPFSELSDDVLITRSPQEPGKVVSRETTATSACLWWEKPKGPDKVSYYEVKYRSCGDAQWSSVNTKQPTESLDVKDLKSKNNYEFKVRAIFSNGNEGPFSEVSATVTTQVSLAAQLKERATKVYSGNPQTYKVPLTFSKETTNTTAMTRKGKFGARDKMRPTKTLMVVGATGAGKSTLIDGMINYIVDVAWEDDFRFTMIDLTEDEKAKSDQQTLSQTNWITCYEVYFQHGSRLDYNLNIIDTPGFGDTRGIEQDKKIVDQIREFFLAPGDQGIDSIDGICFITQAPLARLTHTQKYIFDAILSVFGKDVKDNIFVLITFADGKEPPVLAALKEAKVPFQQAFNFNNSALFERTDSSDQFAQMFWKLGVTSFDKFFAELNRVKQKSLQLTSEVLALRKQIENTIDCLQPQIQDGLHELNTMKNETEVLERHKRDIEANRNFTYLSEELHQRKVDTKPGQYVTNCPTCNFTCHKVCSFADDNDKAKCCAMDTAGNCRECTGKCHWSKHRNNGFFYETYIEKQEKTYENLKAKYESADAGEKKQASVLDKIKSAFKVLGRSVMSMMKTVRESVNKLEQDALKPNPLNEVNYVKLLIDSEKREVKPGWEARVQILEEMKTKAEFVQKIPDASVQEDWTDEDVARFLKTV